MTKYPYLVAHTRLKPFLTKIQSVGMPSVVDKKWRTTIRYGSPNDGRMLPLIEFIGFIDSNGKPNDRWQAYRSTSRAKQVMAQGIREGYADLFHTYPDAYERSDADLADYFRSASDSGDATINRMVTAFRLLCDMADFTAENGASVVSEASKIVQDTSVAGDVPVDMPTGAANGATNDSVNGATNGATEAGIHSITRTLATGVTLNINIQLTVPDTTDEKVYDNFFAALKKHLLS